MFLFLLLLLQHSSTLRFASSMPSIFLKLERLDQLQKVQCELLIAGSMKLTDCVRTNLEMQERRAK